ncbi:acyl-CoA dehydrogenase family protein [Streptomyces minutiscleroticus]|uniref:Monooxygenase n=1 Tax=Streptomyces minutiscleroticus TaxID=68238 RepID=A0A918U9T5_9ACTN|nr:acyl-CoA dehydrogenase family protein [Streptomyces minutiscleroticus]GGY13474.1 monooxygenase [Streptomyces minutiscleroticus]
MSETTVDPVHSGRVPTTDRAVEWLRRAEAVAGHLALGAGRRDREGAPPASEIRLLKDTGLVTLLGPVEYGGGGQSWPVAHRVVRTVSAADASIGTLLAHHYVWLWIAEFIGTDEKIQHIGEVATRARWFFSGSARPRSAPLTISDTGGDMLFDGRLERTLGHRVSDITMLEGFPEDGDVPISALAMSNHDRLTFEPEPAEFGLRSVAAGTVVADRANIPWSGALGHVHKTFVPRVYNTFLAPTLRLAQANVLIGTAAGALRAAEEYTRARWSDAPPSEPAADVSTRTYGALTARLWAVEALADAVGEESGALHARRRRVTEEERGRHAVRVAALAAQAADAADEITAGVFRAAGATGAEAAAGLDRFWRDVQALRVHEPATDHCRTVGRHVLCGEVPQPTWYA